MSTLTETQMTPLPANKATRKALYALPDDEGYDRVVIDCDIPARSLTDTWQRTIDVTTGLEVEVRRADCGAGCRCAAEVRLPAVPHMTPRLAELINVIADDFGPKRGYYAARPYVAAIRTLPVGAPAYEQDSLHDLLSYLNVNLATWRGPRAAEVKAHIRTVLGR